MAKRTEYPRPQFVREQWQCLNGRWQFAFDDKDQGLEAEWFDINHELKSSIEVPFAYQSKLSGIHDSSLHDLVWYKRFFAIDPAWKGQRVLLHFGAVDYRASVYVNGKYAGSHEGGHTPFYFDITNLLNWTEEQVTVRAEDPSEDETIPRGKQYWLEKPDSIWYTRTTGIWQPVWLEPVRETRIGSLHLTPDLDQGNVIAAFDLIGDAVGTELALNISFQGETIVSDVIEVRESFVERAYQLLGRHIFRTPFHHQGWTWTPETPNLFDVTVKLISNGKTVDQVDSYFGLRKVHTEQGMVYLNNKPYYQKLVLDQGYWPEGLLTAPEDGDFIKDINLSKAMGFNGCRKHQKVEDPRFLYWADKLGFLVWGECASAVSYTPAAAGRLMREWEEIIERDYNHPCIVVWVPLNESWGIPGVRSDKRQQHHSLTMYHLVHSMDDTRLVISNDGWEMTKTDICAVHNYNHGEPQQGDKYTYFRQTLSDRDQVLRSQPSLRKLYANGFSYAGEPILLTEFGGIAYVVGGERGWGYTSVASEEEFVQEYGRIMNAVYDSTIIHGFCYTQLTDVEQEVNGLLTYNREPKCDLEVIKQINSKWHRDIVTDVLPPKLEG